MRTIKFRAWDKITEQMCEVWEIGFQHWHRTPGLNFVNIQADGKEERLPDEVELMQFTGLLDRNGKEIYEGDVVLGISDGDPNDETFPQKYNEEKDEYEPCGKYEVRWMENCIGFNLWDGKGWIESDWNIFSGGPVLEVIGNVHENPELIGGRL